MTLHLVHAVPGPHPTVHAVVRGIVPSDASEVLARADPADVLRHLHRATAAGRARLARDPLTAHFLLAGTDLAARGAPGRNSWALGALSQRSLADEVGRRTSLRVSTSALRDRWVLWEDYLDDLTAFVTWPEHWPDGSDAAEDVARYVDGAPGGAAAALRALVHGLVAALARSVLFRAELRITTAGSTDEHVRDRLRLTDAARQRLCGRVLAHTLAVLGLMPAHGLHPDLVADHVVTLVSGAAVRVAGGSDSRTTALRVARSLEHVVTAGPAARWRPPAPCRCQAGPGRSRPPR